MQKDENIDVRVKKKKSEKKNTHLLVSKVLAIDLQSHHNLSLFSCSVF